MKDRGERVTRSHTFPQKKNRADSVRPPLKLVLRTRSDGHYEAIERHSTRATRPKSVDSCGCLDSVCTHLNKNQRNLLKASSLTTPTMSLRSRSLTDEGTPISLLTAHSKTLHPQTIATFDIAHVDNNLENSYRSCSASIISTMPTLETEEDGEVFWDEGHQDKKEHVEEKPSTSKTSIKQKEMKNAVKQKEEKNAELDKNKKKKRRRKKLEKKKCHGTSKRLSAYIRLVGDGEDDEGRLKKIRDMMGDLCTEEQARLYVEVEKGVQNTVPHGKLSDIELGGRFVMEMLSDGSYPEEYSSVPILYVCDGCFQYYRTLEVWRRHAMKCRYLRIPPGDEVYRDERAKLFVQRVDGETEEIFCSNLCLLAMCWLKDKCVYLDTHMFEFYVLYEMLDENVPLRPVGYFSKQKMSKFAHNLSCFCVFPCYQMKGYGRFLIHLSYIFSRLSDLPGGPERPLSNYGLLAYASYWKRTILLELHKRLVVRKGPMPTVEDLVFSTGMRKEDIIECIRALFVPGEGDVTAEVTLGSIIALADKEKKKDRGKVYPSEEKLNKKFLEELRSLKDMIEREWSPMEEDE